MRKFKHKKTGDIAELVSNSGYKLAQSTVGLIPQEYIENSSDWEEIVENTKDYQILSFSYPKAWDADLATLCDDGLYKRNESSWRWDLNSLLNAGVSVKSGDIKIHSVKRLSDDEVFTIGDEVESTIANLGRPTELTGFKIINDKLKFGLRDLGYYPSSTIIKSKNPLFKTEDGVDIFEGDLVWRVSKQYYFMLNYKGEIMQGKGHSNYLTFSTKKAAEEYILMNKPCLNINDVYDILEPYGFNKPHYREEVLEKLKELVKSKL
jgi:hypothetical protein